MKKIVTSLAVASILSVSAVADTDGVFVGIQGSTGFDYAKVVDNSTTGTTVTTTYPSWQIGILGGYKMFFIPKVGARFYGLINYKSSSTNAETADSTAATTTTSDTTNSILSLSANADVLFNFISKQNINFGVFGGFSLGYTSSESENEADDGTGTITITRTEYGSGLDFGINLGLRALLAQKHGLELYSRIGLTEQKKSISGGSYKYSTPFTLGLRYTYSF